MLHALIVADMEGITDVYNFDNIDSCSKLYTDEILVYVNALFENGITKITICDAHDEGSLISGVIIANECPNRDNLRLLSRVENLTFDEKYDFAILVGFHGMSGSPGILSHTLRFDFKEVLSVFDNVGAKIPIGEVEIYTRWLGQNGIPVIFVSGDREAIYEANCFNPYRQTCCVKSYFQTTHLDKSYLYDKIACCIKNSLSLNWSACLSEDSFKIEIEFNNRDTSEVLANCGYKRKENKILFDSCTDLVNNLFTLLNRLNDIIKSNFLLNQNFIKDAKKLVSSLNKADIEKSYIRALLNINILSLDQEIRTEIMKGLKDITQQSNLSSGVTNE